MRRTFRIAWLGLIVVAAVGGTIVWGLGQKNGAATTSRTTLVQRRDLVATIGATGTVEPEEVVDVGAQVAGQISAFGKDKDGKSIDYGSAVEQGTVLVQIDDALYRADMEAAKANLAVAQAAVVQALAPVHSRRESAAHGGERRTVNPLPAASPAAGVDAASGGRHGPD